MAIVAAKDAQGARITNANGLRTDSDGLAEVSNLSVFAQSEITLDPKGLPLNIILNDSTSQRVVPTAAAVVHVQLKTENGGRPAVFKWQMQENKPLPFGADVLDATGQKIGTVAQAGKIFVYGLKTNEGQLPVKWGENVSQQCRANYSLEALPENSTDNLTIVTESLDCK